MQGRAQAGLLRPKWGRDPPDESGQPGNFKQAVVCPVGHVAGEAGGIRSQEAAAEIDIQVTDLADKHRTAVVEALFRPPEHHPRPLNEDREQQGKHRHLSAWAAVVRPLETRPCRTSGRRRPAAPSAMSPGPGDGSGARSPRLLHAVPPVAGDVGPFHLAGNVRQALRHEKAFSISFIKCISMINYMQDHMG